MPNVPDTIYDQQVDVAVAQVEEEEEELIQTSAQPQQPAAGTPAGGTGGSQQSQAPTATGAGGERHGGGGEGPGDGGGDEGQAGGGEQDDSQEPQRGTGPAGSGEHVVRDGDCISSIAKQTGQFWERVWNDPANSDLKRARQDPNVLLPGDRVTIPELRRREEPGETEQHHRFRRRGEPAKLRIRLVKEPDSEQAEQQGEYNERYEGNTTITEDPDPVEQAVEDEPRANVPYVLDIDGERHEGSTDADGFLEAPMPGNARRGKLILNPGMQDEEEFMLQLGRLSPITEVVGVKQRLANLTFDCGDHSEQMTDGLREAIKAFQSKHGMEPNGELTEEVRQKIQTVHGS